MAMTKKEQAEMDALRVSVLVAKALSWPTYRPEQIDTSAALADAALIWDDGGREHVKAWSFNIYAESVHQGGFDSVSHFIGERPSGWSQKRGGPWFRTREDALMALRIALTDKFARELAKIDAQIEGEQL